ncbi:MAG: tRNA pseudouridine(38-40) synthase TruA [Clostridiales bacterium]|nr:tRNA pseudouridine(38-40) synthase TruA [Clostridiales bacterium]
MKTYLLYIAYDGTDFHGWQKQKNVVTVQAAVEQALSALVKQEVAVTASGRTDEGVHALHQAVSFACETPVPAASFPSALNALLPPSVRALSCCEAEEGFCARKAAKRKTYVYRFYLSEQDSPVFGRYALRVGKPLDLPLLQKACEMIVGTHDFSGFYCMGSSAKTTVRTIYDCSFAFRKGQGIEPDGYEFRICGNGFLYKMVRLLVSALLRVENGTLSLSDFSAAVCSPAEAKGKSVKKIPAPSHGLFLESVEYV